MNERLGCQPAFALGLDKGKNVFRQTHLTGHGRHEDDAERAWHMALMAYLLREYANELVDIARVMLMCLLHDVVEIDADDTYAYDKMTKESQAAREAAAAERIFRLLPEDQVSEFRALFAELDAGESADAHFARTMDNLQPLLLNDNNDGDDWKEHAVTVSQVYGRQYHTFLGSVEFFRVTDEILQRHIAVGHIRNETKEGGNAQREANSPMEQHTEIESGSTAKATPPLSVDLLDDRAEVLVFLVLQVP